MEHIYHPRGVCSREMRVEVEDGIIRQVKVIGGCDGNLKGISKLLVGMRAEDAIEKLEDLSPEEVVRIFAKELGAGEPQKTADDEYSFQYVRNGISHRSIFRARKDHFLLITVNDEAGRHQETIEAMLKSLKEK